MKSVLLGFIMLLVLVPMCIAVTSTEQPKNVEKQSAQLSASPSITSPTQASDVKSPVKHRAVMTEAEANSLRVNGDSLLAQSGVSEIAVGDLGGNDLIYVLLVVLLVVVIIGVAAR